MLFFARINLTTPLKQTIHKTEIVNGNGTLFIEQHLMLFVIRDEIERSVRSVYAIVSSDVGNLKSVHNIVRSEGAEITTAARTHCFGNGCAALARYSDSVRIEKTSENARGWLDFQILCQFITSYSCPLMKP